MKLYTINPYYTSLLSVIIFAALTSSFSLDFDNGKTYLNLKYEIVNGGNKALKVDGAIYPGLKSYRKLTVDEILKLQEKKKNFILRRKKELEEREKERENERKRQLEEETKNMAAQREAERVQRGTEVPISQKQRTPNKIQNKKPSRVASRKKLPQKK